MLNETKSVFANENYKIIMRRSFFFSMISLLMFLILTASEIKSQSLDSLINEAVKNNPHLKSLSYKIKSAEYKAEAVNNLPPPTLGIEFSQIPTNTIDLWKEPLSQSLSLSQMFHLGGKLGAMTEAERKNVSIIGTDYDSYKSSLIAQVKMSYYSIWMIERKIEIQNQNILLLRDLNKSLEILYQVNKASQAEMLTIENELASGETQLVVLKNEKNSEQIRLNKYLGRDLEAKGILTQKEIRKTNLNDDAKNLEVILLEENPSLRKMNEMIEMNNLEITANQKEIIPDLMIQAMIMRMPKGMVLTTKTPMDMIGMGETEYMYSLMASITLPFAPWSSGKIASKEEELRFNIKGIAEEKKDMQREMLASLKTLFNKAKSSSELISLYSEKVIPISQKTVEAQTSAFQNRLVNINAVIDSYKMLQMNEMNLYMAQADYQMNLAEIEMMIGKQIFNR